MDSHVLDQVIRNVMGDSYQLGLPGLHGTLTSDYVFPLATELCSGTKTSAILRIQSTFVL